MSSILNFGSLIPRGEIPTQVTPVIGALPSAETARDRRNRLARERRARKRQLITPEQRAAKLEENRMIREGNKFIEQLRALRPVLIKG